MVRLVDQRVDPKGTELIRCCLLRKDEGTFLSCLCQLHFEDDFSPLRDIRDFIVIIFKGAEDTSKNSMNKNKKILTQ